MNAEGIEKVSLSLLKQAIALRQEQPTGAGVAAAVMSLVMSNAAD